MRKATVVLISAGVLIASCAAPAPSNDDSGTAVYVERSGSSVREKRLGAAALVRVRGEQARERIRLELSFMSGGRVVDTDTSEIPYCHARTECWWGESRVLDSPGGGSWESVRVRVIGDGGGYTEGQGIRKLEVTSDPDAVVITPAGEEGVVYVVASQDGAPSFGMFLYVSTEERTPLRITRGDFPVRDGERVRAFLYPGPVPPGVYGPAD